MGDWRDGLTFPMPKIYVPDTDYIGKKVKLKKCEYHEHLNPAKGFTRKEVSLTGNCNCKLKGKTLTITGMVETARARFYHSTCYTVAESCHIVHEFEFSSEIEKPGVISGYIIEGKNNHFVSAGWNYVHKEKVTDGYLHNTGVAKNLLKLESKLSSVPTKAYPAEFDIETSQTRITGEALSWEQLREKILMK